MAGQLAHAGHGTAGSAWSPLFPVVLLAAGYVLAAVRDPRGWDHRRTASWLVGCALLAVAVGPLAQLPDNPSGHMAQHLLLGMLAPLGLVLAAPVTLLLRVAPPPVRRAIGRLLRARPLHLLAHPVTAALLSTGGLALVLLTPLYAAAERHSALHHALHLHYVAAGYLFAWSLAGPDPAPRRPGLAVRIGALLGAAAGHAVLAKYLYAHAETLPPGLADRDPEAFRAAAQLMYYGGDLAELLLAVAVFATWYNRPGRRRPPRLRRVQRNNRAFSTAQPSKSRSGRPMISRTVGRWSSVHWVRSASLVPYSSRAYRVTSIPLSGQPRRRQLARLWSGVTSMATMSRPTALAMLATRERLLIGSPTASRTAPTWSSVRSAANATAARSSSWMKG
ncbi:cytochrome c oxidase assembly protein [Micromonospora ureilytica]|uniref:Membrane protein n=1 Tax=Micromonospora ureilytica TaxID=709868 RepID=A0ABS0JMI1_9ACTN|nr:cytochrome c oxidase assembly protein [Micromonospora ureilytica]MBG6068248.1 putative membrane protein [Micromonospora ureilytica]